MRSDFLRDKRGYATVEEAGTAGTPARFVRVLAVRELATHAAVLVEENEPPRVHEALTVLERADGAWYKISEGGVGHGSMTWTSTDDDDDADEYVGVGCAVYQLPGGVPSAVVRSNEWSVQLEASPSGWVIAVHWPVTCADWQPQLVPGR